MSAKQFNQSDLSAQTGIGKSNISQYLSGKNIPKTEYKEKLASALGVPVSYFDDEPKMPDFIPQLKTAMSTKNMKPARLAEASGIAKSSISEYISGVCLPDEPQLEKLAAALDIPVTKFSEKVDPLINLSAYRNVSVRECAALLGKTPQFVRVALQRGTATFGMAVQISNKRWSYHISAKKLNEYIG